MAIFMAEDAVGRDSHRRSKDARVIRTLVECARTGYYSA
jgi:ribosomal protein L32